VMGLDLEQRYQAIDGAATTHVCTGNAAYRAGALRAVGLFDETFGYGYDNDLSYRLRAAGYRLLLCRGARSVHRWREGWLGYLGQQYGFGYGRIDLVAKHPGRIAGDSVSPPGMMSHPLLMTLAIANLLIALAAALAHGPWRPFAMAAATLVTGLALERLAAGISAARRFRTATPLIFPVLHLARDVAWSAAIAMWAARRIVRCRPHPAHSMRPRASAAASAPPIRVATASPVPAQSDALPQRSPAAGIPSR
jgi:hypothetical protein